MIWQSSKSQSISTRPPKSATSGNRTNTTERVGNSSTRNLRVFGIGSLPSDFMLSSLVLFSLLLVANGVNFSCRVCERPGARHVHFHAQVMPVKTNVRLSLNGLPTGGGLSFLFFSLFALERKKVWLSRWSGGDETILCCLVRSSFFVGFDVSAVLFTLAHTFV